MSSQKSSDTPSQQFSDRQAQETLNKPEIKPFDYFGDRVSWLDQLRMNASLKVRRQMYEWWRNQLGGVQGKAILDHGSTPDTEHIDSNCFIQWLLADGAIVYATSPEPIEHLENIFPGLTVVAFPPQAAQLPPLAGVLSSAVVEHVGNEASQIRYCRELLQLAPSLCVTTPNRFHWLDFHTKLPLIHWLPRSWHRAILRAIGLHFWAEESNLRLLSKADLTRIISHSLTPDFASIHSSPPKSPQAENFTVEWCEPKFLGLVSNLVVCIQMDQPLQRLDH